MRPRRVLEIGTFCGYATLCLAEGLAEGACCTPLKSTRRRKPHTALRGGGRAYGAGATDIGAALDVLPGWSMKCGIWSLLMPTSVIMTRTLRPLLNRCGRVGLLIVDNVLWSGKVLPDSRAESRRQRYAGRSRLQRQGSAGCARGAGVAALARRAAAAPKKVSPLHTLFNLRTLAVEMPSADFLCFLLVLCGILLPVSSSLGSAAGPGPNHGARARGRRQRPNRR